MINYSAKSNKEYFLDTKGKKEQEKAKILMVDDRPENLLALKAVLDHPNYHLICVHSGEEALKKVLHDDFAVILLDVQMPGLNGFETAKLIKKREKSKHIPIIFITAISQAKEHVSHGYSVGAIDYIFKPFQPDTLKMKVEAFVKIYQYQNKIQQQSYLLKQRTIELEQMNEKLNEVAVNLRKAEALARIIGDTSLDAIFTFDETGYILTVNPAVYDMFGYQTSELEGKYIGHVFSSIKKNDKRIIQLIKKNISERDIGKLIETMAVRRDGSSFPVEIQMGDESIDNNSMYVCFIRDITERKQQYVNLEKLVDERTKELSKSNRQIESILKSISDAFYAVDHDWRFTYVNEEAELRIGKRREEIIGEKLTEVYLHPSSEEYTLFQNAVREHMPAHFEVLKDNGHWYSVFAYPSETGLSVYFGDITERKKMEEDLRLSQERFQKIFQSSPNLIEIRTLKDGRYIDVNVSWLEYTKYTREEVEKLSAEDIYKTSLNIDSNQKCENFNFEKPMRNVHIYYLTKKGEIREGLLSTEIIEIHGEQCIVSVITDVTEKEHFEKEMARLDRLNLIGEMAAGIAHEIRNPMTTVRGFLQVSRNNPTTDYIDLMLEELDRANSIITEFLTLAKNKTTNRKMYQLNDIINAIYPLIQAEALLSDKSIILKLKTCPSLLLDEKEIRQMILNLALNGLEAMPTTGELRIRTYCSNNEVILQVEDQGTGIDNELLEKIGTPFFTTKEKGTGLGLAVCYSVAARHQAVIEVKTSEKGTTFIVRFRQEQEK